LKLLCIIQGPLITYGQGPNNHKGGFNIFDSLLKNVMILKSEQIEYVYVTWEPKNFEEKELEKKLLLNKINFHTITPPDCLDIDHRFKHHYSLLHALNYVEKDNYDLIFKIRSDQVINGEIINDLKSSDLNKLFVSELMINNPFYVGDFIYAATPTIFYDFLNSQAKNNYLLHSVIANDIGMKYFISKSKRSKFFLLILYFLFPNRASKKWWAFAEKNIQMLKESNWNDIQWRGREIRSIINSNKFIFSDSLLFETDEFKMSNLKYYFNGIVSLLRKLVRQW